jgi:eukaryotic-like serine/threonine-protein kinase
MFAPGEILENKYRIIRLIGEGGMGSVFEAEATRLHRRVAIKVLHAGSAGEGEMAARFQLEAQAAGRIGSRHIVEVIDLGQLPDGAHYMVMEFLEGQSLRQRIAERGAMTASDLFPIAEQLLTGVGAAHAAGIIHRDLKPDNVFLVRQPDGKDFVKILDFGISKFGGQSGPGGRELSLTRTGALMGTPFYLAPEQANGSKGIDQRTDLYTVGVILYECIAGVVPHAADTFNQLLFRIVLEPPPPILDRVPSADPSFVAIIERAMAKEPKLRFQSADEMSQALAGWAQGAPLSRSLGPDASARHSAHPALARNSTPSPNSRGGTSARDSATLASEPGRDLAHQTVDPWSQSKASNRLDIEDAPGLRPSKLPWVVAGFAGLALLLVVFVLLKRGSVNDPALDAPSSVTAVQIAPPEEVTPPLAKTPIAVEPTVEPAPSPAPSASDVPDSSVTPPVMRGSTPRAPTRSKSGNRSAPAAVEPEPSPAPVAAPAPVPVPPPAAAPTAAPAPTTTADVSRTRGGRAIRGDL